MVSKIQKKKWKMVNYKNFHPHLGHLRYCTRKKKDSKKKEKRSRDHVLGENGKSEDVAEDSQQKQCPSEGNREHHQESESTTNLLALSFFLLFLFFKSNFDPF